MVRSGHALASYWGGDGYHSSHRGVALFELGGFVGGAYRCYLFERDRVYATSKNVGAEMAVLFLLFFSVDLESRIPMLHQGLSDRQLATTSVYTI